MLEDAIFEQNGRRVSVIDIVATSDRRRRRLVDEVHVEATKIKNAAAYVANLADQLQVEATVLESDDRRHMLSDTFKEVMSAAAALTETISLANALNSANADVHVHDRRRVQASGTVEVAFKVVMPTAPGAAEATGTFTSVRNDLAAAASAIATAGTLSSLGSFDVATFVAPELADSTTVKAADSCQGDHILLTSTGEV